MIDEHVRYCGKCKIFHHESEPFIGPLLPNYKERGDNAAVMAIRRMVGTLDGTSRICVICGGRYDMLVKIGRCVYTDSASCGHRQYQGDLPDWAKREGGR